MKTENKDEKIDRLEKELEAFNADTTLVKSYIALKRFIDGINEALMETKVPSGKLSDKDDKMMERVMKFADKIYEYNDTLKKMKKEILPEVLAEAEKKEAGSILEKALKDEG